MTELGKIPYSKVRVFNIQEANKTVANLLGIPEKEQVYYIERVRGENNIPILYEKTYMSVKEHPHMCVSVLESSKYQYAKDNGLNIDYAFQNIAPIFPDPIVAEELHISEKTPIIRIANTTYLKSGNVFDYTELYLHPEYYQLNITKKME